MADIESPGLDLTRRCPSCGAQPGQLCTAVAGVEMTTLVHPSRGKTRRGS